MTKKHFETIAREIAAIPSKTARLYAAHAIARACEHHNERFNRKLFLKACNATN